MATCDFSNWDERYEIPDWDGKIWCITPGEIIEKLLREEDEYGNFFTSYTELSKVCQADGFPATSIHHIAVLCIRHETKMLASGIRNERLPEKGKNGPEMVESVERNTSNILVSHDFFDDEDEEDDDEDLYTELEDHYKFDGEDENALSFFFNYLVSNNDNKIRLNLQKFIEILILNTIFHVNVEYEISDDDYEWSNIWCHDMAAKIWKVAKGSGINIKGLNLFVEKLYLEVLYERLGSSVVPMEDVEDAIQADKFYQIELEQGTEVFWAAWREAEAMSDEETEQYLEGVAWDEFIDQASANLIMDIYPMWTVYTDETIWYDDFEADKYPRGW